MAYFYLTNEQVNNIDNWEYKFYKRIKVNKTKNIWAYVKPSKKK